ncbi:MAG: hypothetical protein HY856_10260 [Burkholderiales bacterium]|nr:hypothetical protein [Burkholderiales bacterium]
MNSCTPPYMKILIVDDDTARTGSLVCHLTRNDNFDEEQVVVAGCVDEARSLLRSTYFDVLVLDVVLPKRTGERASALKSIELLREIQRSVRLKKPEKVIGITAYIEDLGKFQEEFNQYCFAVVAAPRGSSEWKERIHDAIFYTASSKLARHHAATPIHVLTVHGIRTFGQWQTRLQSLVGRRLDSVGFSAYKYGYFSSLAFFVPWLREREVQRLYGHLEHLWDAEHGQKFAIVAHSFGTYLVARALRRFAVAGEKHPVFLLILCGSVLPERFDWRSFFANAKYTPTVVNECADRDFVLWLSKAFVVGTGMAGKGGFHGFTGDSLVNRFHQGGHSCYFYGDSFMEKYWVPLLEDSRNIVHVDKRRYSLLLDGVVERIVCGAGAVKAFVYVAIALLLFNSIFTRL